MKKTQGSSFKGRNIDDRDMILLALGGQAQSRTPSQIERLISQAGYKLGQIAPVEGCDLHIFEAIKEPIA